MKSSTGNFQRESEVWNGEESDYEKTNGPSSCSQTKGGRTGLRNVANSRSWTGTRGKSGCRRRALTRRTSTPRAPEAVGQ